ncbi:MAG: F0F1 ATP synthase subunit A [Verrucomicrobiales bacterium]
MKLLLAVWMIFASAVFGFAADTAGAAHNSVGGAHGPADAHASSDHGPVHHELPPSAVRFSESGFITNSMVATWIVAALLIIFAQIATRNMKEIPSGAQNFWEWLVESLYEFLEGIIGSDLARKTFWFFATLFVFVLFANWFGLVPGVGSVGWGTQTAHGFVIDRPLLRGANADLNMTFAISMVFFVCWTIWALQANGPGGFLMHIFGPKGDTAGALKALMIAVFLAVGLLEVVSILFRPVSLSFRLYGNVFAGESLIEQMAASSNMLLKILVPIPFYFMELLVGMVQALVFMLLTAVFTLLICTHDEGHGHENTPGHSEKAHH